MDYEKIILEKNKQIKELQEELDMYHKKYGYILINQKQTKRKYSITQQDMQDELNLICS